MAQGVWGNIETHTPVPPDKHLIKIYKLYLYQSNNITL